MSLLWYLAGKSRLRCVVAIFLTLSGLAQATSFDRDDPSRNYRFNMLVFHDDSDLYLKPLAQRLNDFLKESWPGFVPVSQGPQFTVDVKRHEIHGGARYDVNVEFGHPHKPSVSSSMIKLFNSEAGSENATSEIEALENFLKDILSPTYVSEFENKRLKAIMSGINEFSFIEILNMYSKSELLPSDQAAAEMDRMLEVLILKLRDLHQKPKTQVQTDTDTNAKPRLYGTPYRMDALARANDRTDLEQTAQAQIIKMIVFALKNNAAFRTGKAESDDYHWYHDIRVIAQVATPVLAILLGLNASAHGVNFHPITQLVYAFFAGGLVGGTRAAIKENAITDGYRTNDLLKRFDTGLQAAGYDFTTQGAMAPDPAPVMDRLIEQAKNRVCEVALTRTRITEDTQAIVETGDAETDEATLENPGKKRGAGSP